MSIEANLYTRFSLSQKLVPGFTTCNYCYPCLKYKHKAHLQTTSIMFLLNGLFIFDDSSFIKTRL